MHARILALAALMLLSVPFSTATHATPSPPAGYTCIGGYNAAAFANVCHDILAPTVTPSSTSTCVFVIGNIPGCTTHPTASFTVPFQSVWVQLLCGATVGHSTTCTTVPLTV